MTLNASKPLARRAAAVSRRMQPRAPVAVAIERLAKLAVTGAPAARMVEAAGGIVAEWRAGAVPPGTLAEQLEALRTEIDDGQLAAEAHVADGDETEMPRVRLQLDALRATQNVLASEAERLP